MWYRNKGQSEYFTYVCAVAIACSIRLFTPSTFLAQQAAPATEGKISQVAAAPELTWPLPPNVDKSYDLIDGQRMKGYVEDLAAISLKSRDAGYKLWGRIAGTPSGYETQGWVEQKFKEINVPFETKEIPMTTQLVPKSWDVTVSANGKKLRLESAMPIAGFAGFVPSAQGEEDLDAVYVGLGQASDFVDRDVRGKAVFIYSIPTPSSLFQSAGWNGALERAQKGGAKAIIFDLAIPGNMKYSSLTYPAALSSDVKVPIFTIGDDDGTNFEALYAAMHDSNVKAHVSWNVETVAGLKEGIVIGKLQGMTDENIVMIAHTDGYFQGATDDGAGTAALIETANYFARMPKKERRRTMYFVALPDHHEGDSGGKWMHDNFQSIFARTAVILNAEHVTAMNAVWDHVWTSSDLLPKLIPTNGLSPSWWGVYGSDKLARIVRDDYATFGVPTQMAGGGSPGELRQVQFDAPSFYLHNKGVYYHTDADTPAIVPAAGLRTAVQAFAKIFNDVNKLDLVDLLARTQVVCTFYSQIPNF